MRASDRTVESSPETGEELSALLVDVLREGGEIAFGVRLRIALDILEDAANQGAEIRPRAREGGLRLEGVRIDAEGIARHDGEGTWGAAEITWEILAGRALKGTPAPLRKVADDVTEAVEALVSRALARDKKLGNLESLAAALEEAGRGWLDTHEDVRHAVGLHREPVDEEVAVSVAPNSLRRVLAGAAGTVTERPGEPARREELLPPPSAEATETAKRAPEGPVSARVADPEDPALLEEVDGAWPTTKSTKPPPAATVPDPAGKAATKTKKTSPSKEAVAPSTEAPAPRAAPKQDAAQEVIKPPEIINLDEDEGTDDPTRVQKPKHAAAMRRSGPDERLSQPEGQSSRPERLSQPDDRPTPDEFTKPLLVGDDIEDPPTPEEPTLLNPKSWRFTRPVIQATPVGVQTPRVEEGAGPRAQAASDPALVRPIPILDEDSADEANELDEETSLYRARGKAAQGKNRLKQQPAVVHQEADAPPPSSREPAVEEEPRTEEDDEEELDSLAPPRPGAWVRTMLVAFLIGGLLAVAAIEIWARVGGPVKP